MNIGVKVPVGAAIPTVPHAAGPMAGRRAVPGPRRGGEGVPAGAQSFGPWAAIESGSHSRQVASRDS